MQLIEAKQNIFNAPDDWYFAHCISRDATMGAGIAKEFVKRFPKLKILQKSPSYNSSVGTCMKVGRVFNLITKEKYWQKPTYNSLKHSLVALKIDLRLHKVDKLTMPRIGCGLDRLEWGKVKPIIEEVFEDMDIKIVVCYL